MLVYLAILYYGARVHVDCTVAYVLVPVVFCNAITRGLVGPFRRCNGLGCAL